MTLIDETKMLRGLIFKLVLTLALPAIASVFIGCASEKSKSNKGGITNPSPSPGKQDASDLCASLKSSSLASATTYSDFINDLCDQNLLSTIRSSSYNGHNDQIINKKDNDRGGNSSYMRLFASYITTSSVNSCFNMIRLQISKPTDFSKMYEYDPAVNYKILSQNGNQVSFNYINKGQDKVIDYDAISNFSTIEADHLHVVTTSMQKANNEVMKSFGALQIINKLSDTTTEVISISDQIFDNQGNHSATVSKAIQTFKQELGRGYRNSLKADSANAFFP